MNINVNLTDKEEKALKFICSDVTGVHGSALKTHLDITDNEMWDLLHYLKQKGFRFEGVPRLKLSTSYAHYESFFPSKKISIT
jgi:hypothetical protein